MPSIPNISFNVKFDLTGTPAMVITDTSTHGLTRTAIFKITQPDNYTVEGDWDTPDLDILDTEFSTPLRLASDGYPQCGNYVIEMTVDSGGYTPTTFTRSFAFDWKQPEVVIQQNLDVFTPQLILVDSTVYAVAGFNVVVTNLNWTANSTPTGPLVGTGYSFSLISGGQFYSADYTATHTALGTYTSIANPWLTVLFDVYWTEAFSVSAPPTLSEIVGLINDLNGDDCASCCSSKFVEAMALYQLIVNQLMTGNTTNIYNNLQQLLVLIGGSTTNITNISIPPYEINTGGVSPTPVSGYAVTIGNGTANSYAITHNLNSTDIHIQVFDLANGEKVYMDQFITGVNSALVTFDDPVPMNQYRVVILRA